MAIFEILFILAGFFRWPCVAGRNVPVLASACRGGVRARHDEQA